MKFILGASDPEMKRIEDILNENNLEYYYAGFETKSGNFLRVYAGNAYNFDYLIKWNYKKKFTTSNLRDYIFIECCPAHIEKTILSAYSKIIDHHKSGDPGFGLPPHVYYGSF